MDVFVLGSLAIGLILLILILAVFARRKSGDPDEQQPRIVRPRQPAPRRAAGIRNARQRMRVVASAAADGSDDENDPVGDDENDPMEVGDVGKLGAKKRAKLEAKAERKAQREAAEREREERRKRDLLLQEERDKESEKERSEEARKEEAEKRAQEEKERKEYEEYLKMKEAFSVEEEGYQEHNDAEQENLLQEFLDHIRENKVVVLEDLAGHFRIKTQNVIERIQDLQAAGSLSGVIDDRGKFIYISQSELEAIAKFVRQRGRVSITELAENSNLLINLTPGKSGTAIHAQ